MRKFNQLLFIQFFFIAFCLMSCTKQDKTATTTQAMFWVDSDFGCGTITVTLNGVSKAITGYNISQPSCGDTYAAIFDIAAGSYTFTAKCSSKTWSGSISVQDGQCNAFKLNSGGGGTTGGGTTNGTPTVTAPSTQFIASQDYTVSSSGAYWTQQFTITTTTSFVFRFASQFQAQAAIITADQLSKFQANQAFSGYALFDKTFGTNYITLNAGTYYVAVRNVATGANKWSLELDNTITLPSSDRATFLDNYASGAKSFAAGSRFWQPFTVQTGYRYFLDGCNVNCDVRIIAANQLTAFQNGQTYQYYTNYYDAGGAAPGFFELMLPVGDYYIISYNSISGALTYTLERWKVN